MQFSIYKESRRGSRRSNQDRIAYCYSKDALLMLVADGMGGHPHGEVAARIATQFITDAFRREAKPALSDPPLFLRHAITGAHHAIHRYAAVDGLAKAPRTSCVACVVQHNAACWGHAGDSRLYHIRNGRILAQTKDHSQVQQLLDQGRIRAEAVAAHPERNRILNCLGSVKPPQVDLSAMSGLDAGDTLILCSDGLWNQLSAKIIGNKVAKSGIMQAVPELLDEAERRAGRECDNLSAIAVTWEENSPAARPDQAPAGGMAPHTAAAPHEQGAAGAQYLSDDDIERALDDIRNAIKRHPNGKT